MRRRRLTRRPSPASTTPSGRGVDHAADTDAGAELFAAAGALIEIAAEAESDRVTLIRSR